MLKVSEFERGIDRNDSVNENFIDFSVESNLHYRYSTAEDLLKDKKTLSAMIEDHYTNQVPRLEVLDDYYKAKNTNIMTNRRRKEKDKADHRSAHNYGKVLTTFDVGYSTGNPIKIMIDDEKEQTAIDEFNTNNDIDGLNSELWLDMDKYGRAYEIQYRDEEGNDCLSLSNVFETFVVYDTTIKREPILAVRYPKSRFSKNADKTFIKPIVYTKDEVVMFKETTLQSIKLVEEDRKRHSYKEVQVTEYSPNRFRLGLYEDVLSLIDLYDSAQSDTANYMTDLNEAMLVISGDLESSGMTTDDAIKQKDANILLLESGTDVMGNKTQLSANYIYKQYDVAGAEAYKDRVRKDIHEIAMIPDLNDEQFSGTQSGEAMKYKLFGFKQMTATKERLFKKGLMRRYRLLFNLKFSLSELTNADLEGMQITFTPNVPKAVLEELKAIIDSGADVSQETMLSLTSFIENPAKELEKIQEEQQSVISQARQLTAFDKNLINKESENDDSQEESEEE